MTAASTARTSRLVKSLVLAAVMIGSSLRAVEAEDMFRKLPTLARSFGQIVPPSKMIIPHGVPISAALSPPQPNSNAFMQPGSTAGVRPGIDPFTNSVVPAR